MAGTQDIQRRIKSITNTKKVTKAMEVVSAAKMKKAVSAVLSLRPYATAMYDMLDDIAPQVATDHPLLSTREVKSVLLIIIGSNKGLCGSFNSSIARVTRELIADPEKLGRSRDEQDALKKSVGGEDVKISFMTIGRKADQLVKLLGKDPIATYPDLNYTPDSTAVRPLTNTIFDGYVDGTYDKVAVIYTDYVNAIVQEQKIRQLLPVSRADLAKHIEEMDELTEDKEEKSLMQYTTEPSREEALEAMVPRVIESQVLHACLESNASKESMRMVAMKNATDAAGDIIDDLTLTYNKIRQAKITQEISEISAGTAALENN